MNPEDLTLSKTKVKKKVESEHRSVVSDSLRHHGLYSSWNSPGKNTGMGSLSLLQEIISTQGLNPGLLHCRQILYQLSHKGSKPVTKGCISHDFAYIRYLARVVHS